MPGVGWKHRHDNPGKYEVEDHSLDISDYVFQLAPGLAAPKTMTGTKESWSQTEPTEVLFPVEMGPELVATGKNEKLPLEAPTRHDKCSYLIPEEDAEMLNEPHTMVQPPCQESGRLTVGYDCAGIGSSIEAVRRVFPSSIASFVTESENETRGHPMRNFPKFHCVSGDLTRRKRR